MRLSLPLLRTRYDVRPVRAPILRYGGTQHHPGADLSLHALRRGCQATFRNSSWPHSPAADGRHHAGNERARIGPTHLFGGPETKVLFMSGYTENAIGHNGVLDAGVNLLQKPFTLPALKSKVRELIDAPIPLEVHMSAHALTHPPMRGRAKVSPFRAQRFNLHLPLTYRPVG